MPIFFLAIVGFITQLLDICFKTDSAAFGVSARLQNIRTSAIELIKSPSTLCLERC